MCNCKLASWNVSFPIIILSMNEGPWISLFSNTLCSFPVSRHAFSAEVKGFALLAWCPTCSLPWSTLIPILGPSLAWVWSVIHQLPLPSLFRGLFQIHSALFSLWAFFFPVFFLISLAFQNLYLQEKSKIKVRNLF